MYASIYTEVIPVQVTRPLDRRRRQRRPGAESRRSVYTSIAEVVVFLLPATPLHTSVADVAVFLPITTTDAAASFYLLLLLLLL